MARQRNGRHWTAPGARTTRVGQEGAPMIPVRARWGLLAAGVLVLGPAAARAGDDTLRLSLPGGPAATKASAPDATTRPLVLTTADEAETTPIGRGGGFHGGGFHG